MAEVIERVFTDAWLPAGKKFLNEQLAQDINRMSSPTDTSGWSDDEDSTFRDQGLEPSRVVEYERLALTRVRRRGALVAKREISAQYRAWASGGQLLRQWSTGTLETPGHADIP